MLDCSAMLSQVNQRIFAAEQKFKRVPNSVKLLAVSKTRSVSEIREVFLAGQVSFAENYVQEAMAKREELNDLLIDWHFIGAIQSNKISVIAEYFDWVHSVDRLKVLHKLNALRSLEKTPLNICLQVNVSGEQSKSGATIKALLPMLEACACLPQIRLRGLMVMPKLVMDFAGQQVQFAVLRELFLEFQHDFHGLDTLSMGTSGDLEAAISVGSTMVRVGSAIFGARHYDKV